MTTQALHREEEVLGLFRVNSPLSFPESPSGYKCHLVLGLAKPGASLYLDQVVEGAWWGPCHFAK